MTQVRIFLSTVSAEFSSYRNALRHDLERPNLTVKVQEDFIVTGTETLDMLDDYIRQCDAVIHLVGDMTGVLAQAPSLAIILDRYPDIAQRLPPLCPFLKLNGQALSYTQWEAWLALYHRKVLIIAVPEEGAPRDVRYELIDEQHSLQQQHLSNLAVMERYPGIRFASADRLAVEILRSKLHDILARVGAHKKPVNLPIASINELFKGRETWLDDLSRSLGPVLKKDYIPVVARVLSGLGGVGKTRLALEYAWGHAENYTARLFVGADSVEILHRNLAALCRPLELDEQWETDETRQRDAVLKWLNHNPCWLLILDNIDTQEVAAAVELLLPKLFGGHLLITSRLLNWSSSLKVLPVDILSSDAATEFLLKRTDDKRRGLTDDNIQARILAEALGCLALALEQAGAYIYVKRLTLKDYLEKWHSQRDSVLAWYDPRLMQYPKSVAVTWQTTFDQLDKSARQLLQRLAWLSPESIPESLLKVPIDGDDSEVDSFSALAELESYSLLTRATDSQNFSVHRLIQVVTQSLDPKYIHLTETLRWINDAFVGDPQDVRTWGVLNPLQPHVQSVIEYAHNARITIPAVRLMIQLGVLYFTKSLHTEAEPLMRRALAIDEVSYGSGHPNVARDLNNLAQLLKATNRLAEAEPLMRRALAIDEVSYGLDHYRVAIRLNNMAALLQATNRLPEAESLMRRALAIDESSYGSNHSNIALDLSNLAQLLQDANNLTEAEPLMQRALAIDELTFGPNHPNVARDLNNLATLLMATDRLAEAEPLMRRALPIDEISYGPDHPNVARDLTNLAQLLKATNRLAEAEPLMRRALVIDEVCYGSDHPNVALDLNNLALLLQDTNRLKEAELMMQQALTIDELSYGPDHPNVARDLNNLAQLLQDTKHLAEAESLMRRSLAINEASFKLDHPNVARDLNNLALLLKDTNRLNEAAPMMLRALTISIKSLGAEHSDSYNIGVNYISLLQELGRTEDEIKANLEDLLS